MGQGLGVQGPHTMLPDIQNVISACWVPFSFLILRVQGEVGNACEVEGTVRVQSAVGYGKYMPSLHVR